jgi:hypothetical protein
VVALSGGQKHNSRAIAKIRISRTEGSYSDFATGEFMAGKVKKGLKKAKKLPAVKTLSYGMKTDMLKFKNLGGHRS